MTKQFIPERLRTNWNLDQGYIETFQVIGNKEKVLMYVNLPILQSTFGPGLAHLFSW
jgi:hypothetical protein